MENEDWYYHDKKQFIYKLTPQASPKAVESYQQFYEELNSFDVYNGRK